MTRAVAFRLIAFFVVVGALIALFESTKQLLWPDINVWQSHIITIFFSSTAATIIAYLAFVATDKSTVSTGSERVGRWIKLLIAAGITLMTAPTLAVLILIRTGGSQDDSTFPHELRLATTTSTVDSGLLNMLIPIFEKKTGYKVRVFAKGTGAALEAGKSGGADVVLVHARTAEDQFVQSGFGINRQDVMYNDFVILGPEQPDDDVPVSRDAVQTLKSIQSAHHPFVSRADNSGTHMREKELWRLVEVEPKGDWYTEAREEMLATLRLASERQAYAISDRGTYLANRKELHMRIVCEGDSRLFNRYGVIAVSPMKVTGVNFKAAMAFVRFLISDEGQAAIGRFGINRFKQPLFVPSARK
jgi:tungstate transport system substrate-binding protein